VGPRASLDAVVNRKTPSSFRDSKPRSSSVIPLRKVKMVFSRRRIPTANIAMGVSLATKTTCFCVYECVSVSEQAAAFISINS
jgi:hypothetical protein